MKAQGRVGGKKRLAAAETGGREVNGVAANRMPKVPEMDANLIGAACERTGFQKRRSVGMVLQHAKIRAGGETMKGIHNARPGLNGLAADRRSA